jgi:threonine/homoserine efflux transporter RhtA
VKRQRSPGTIKIAAVLSALAVGVSIALYFTEPGQNSWFVDRHLVAVVFAVVALTGIWVVALFVHALETWRRTGSENTDQRTKPSP